MSVLRLREYDQWQPQLRARRRLASWTRRAISSDLKSPPRGLRFKITQERKAKVSESGWDDTGAAAISLRKDDAYITKQKL